MISFTVPSCALLPNTIGHIRLGTDSLVGVWMTSSAHRPRYQQYEHGCVPPASFFSCEPGCDTGLVYARPQYTLGCVIAGRCSLGMAAM
jgi:hypothetical protein